MTGNAAIFDTVRPWLDRDGFNKPGRIDALDNACAAALAARDPKPIYDAVRPMLDAQGFNPKERRDALDAAFARYLESTAPSGTDAVAAGTKDGLGGALIGGLGDAMAEFLTPQPAPAPAPAPADDRYLPLVQRLAGPGAKPEVLQAIARSFAQHAPAYGQDRTKDRIADFFAQTSNETGGYTRFDENLNYSAERLHVVWPGRFPRNPVGGQRVAEAYAHNPQKLANYVYGNRGGNGNEASGDGWKFRGRGPLGLTFHDNYALYGRLLNLPLLDNPDLAADPTIGTLIALEFYKQGNVNHWIDAGDTKAARGITNAGDPHFAHPIGLDEVNRRRRIALQELG